MSAPSPACRCRRRCGIRDAVMKNLVGPEEIGAVAGRSWPRPGLIPHHYGKTEARPGRKMGHVTRLFPRGGLPGAFGVAAALGAGWRRPRRH